jgi:hypothetical protein
MEMKGKTEELLLKQLKLVKRICKNSLTPQNAKPENHGY